MKFLLDTCVWGGALNELQSAGHDVIWAGDWPDDPGDDEILERAHAEGRTLVTLDKDFRELAVFYGRPHSGIIRLVDIGARQQVLACLRVIDLHKEDLKSAAIITVEPNKLRIRSATSQEK